MDTHVEEHKEGGVAASDEPKEDPADHGHDGVVDHMEGRQLVVLLLQNHEERIHEVDEF